MTSITEKSTEKQLTFIQYFNTALLTIMCGASILIYTQMATFSNDQAEQNKELIRIKTVQDYNTSSLNTINYRINALEQDSKMSMQKWVDDNYIRKQQK